MRTDILALFIGIVIGNPTYLKALMRFGEKANDTISKKMKELNDNLVKEKKDDTQVL